jgi:hypothetical protein
MKIIESRAGRSYSNSFRKIKKRVTASSLSGRTELTGTVQKGHAEEQVVVQV